MNGQKSPPKSPNKRDSMTEPSEAMADLVEIKQEPDIKKETDIQSKPDEPCIVTYTHDTSTPSDNIFAPIKVEKVDSDSDYGDGDEDDVGNGRDEAFDLLEKFGDFDSLNLVNLIAIFRTQPMDRDTECPLQRADHPFEENDAAKQQSERTNVDDARALSAPEFDVNKFDVKSIRKKRSAPKPNRKLHKCSECNYVTINSGHLKVHMLKHTGEKPFACDHCPKRFTSTQNLRTHLKVHVNKDSLNCSICWTIFATQSEKSEHESTCKRRRYECFLCHASLTLKISNLKTHMRVHNGIRPFQCELCQRKFTRKGSMKRHLKTHTNSRPLKFQCSVCARNFLEQTEKDQHESNCRRRRYECYVCQSYVTANRGDLQWHMRMHHTGERPWKCSLCMKCYPMKSTLNFHVKKKHNQ